MNEYAESRCCCAVFAMQGRWMIYSEQNIPQDSLVCVFSSQMFFFCGFNFTALETWESPF